jgi:hypothetical protein
MSRAEHFAMIPTPLPNRLSIIFGTAEDTQVLLRARHERND